MAALTRGPLPARVYWRRRMAVLGVPLVLLGLGVRALGGDDAPADRALQVSSAPAPSAAPDEEVADPPVADDSAAAQARKRAQRAAERSAQPDGPCDPAEISVTPEVPVAVAGRRVPLELHLRSTDSAACTFTASRRTLTLRITSGSDEVWTARQCPASVPTRDLILRDNLDVTVTVVWSARRSTDERCSAYNQWALPGYYHLEAAAYAGEPRDRQFELVAPSPEVVVRPTRAEIRAQREAERRAALRDQRRADRHADRGTEGGAGTRAGGSGSGSTSQQG